MQEQRKTFHLELDTIRADIVRLAALVTEFIPRGTELLLANDLEGAQQLIEDDDVIDDLALRIEDHCYHVLALQQPMASDLRAIVTAIRLTSEIERSGDLMVNVAKGSRRLYGAEFDARLRGLIERMGEEACRLFKLAVDAYVEHNAGLAAALDDMDDQLDALHGDYIQAIFEAHHEGTIDLQASVQLALIGRYYERIGDHAVNIGQRVEYMVTGWLPEHSGAARAEVRKRVHDEIGEHLRAESDERSADDVPGPASSS
ncbi:MAG: phosphate signaling complex protein PhoU [Acidimicrobiales bacterium]|jgi:phosphate transport system protein|nr:phosphate signaling complex protein PhoU [Acidimicrobiales bacterium]